MIHGSSIIFLVLNISLITYSFRSRIRIHKYVLQECLACVYLYQVFNYKPFMDFPVCLQILYGLPSMFPHSILVAKYVSFPADCPVCPHIPYGLHSMSPHSLQIAQYVPIFPLGCPVYAFILFVYWIRLKRSQQHSFTLHIGAEQPPQKKC